MRTWESIVFSEQTRVPCHHHQRLSTDWPNPGHLAPGHLAPRHLAPGSLGRRRAGRLLAALVLCVVVGCGNTKGTFAVSGTVSVEGQPLEQGSISFVSATPGSRSSTGGAIANGKYSIAAEDGLVPGTYRVTISAADMSNATAAGLPANGLAFPSLVDPAFNRANHEIEVTSEGPNSFAFDVPKNKKQVALPF